MAKRTLEQELDRLKAYNEVQNLMGKYEFYHSAGMHQPTAELFARKDPDVCVQIGGWGVYRGYKNVITCYAKLHVWDEGKDHPEKYLIGRMIEHDLTTGVIEVAGDGNTARAVWMSPGHETTVNHNTGIANPGWCWMKYACEFLKEDGIWRIWHLFTFLNFYAAYAKGWGAGGNHPAEISMANKPAGLIPSGPSFMRHNPYSPTYTCQLLPAFPNPYETWDGIGWIDPGNKDIQGKTVGQVIGEEK
jgi:hypothetical protein